MNSKLIKISCIIGILFSLISTVSAFPFFFSMSEFIGPLTPQVTISTNVTDYNLAEDLSQNYGWNGKRKVLVRLRVENGSIISSSDTNVPAFNTGSLPAGSKVTMDNYGEIIGTGGDGGIAWSVVDNSGARGPANGQPGGDAINTSVNMVINNRGLIGGGGGGGGGSSYNTANSGCWGAGAGFVGGAGGGGAGYNPGSGGAGGIRQWSGGCCQPSNSAAGSSGSKESGGSGSGSPSSCGFAGGGPGGAGGDLGENGATGSPYAGGAAGASVASNGKTIIWSNVGDRRGPIE